MSGSPPTQFYERRKKSQCDVDVMSMSMKEAQGILNLVLQPRGQCIGTTHEVVCTLIHK
jgi:hypothetical protein